MYSLFMYMLKLCHIIFLTNVFPIYVYVTLFNIPKGWGGGLSQKRNPYILIVLDWAGKIRFLIDHNCKPRSETCKDLANVPIFYILLGCL